MGSGVAAIISMLVTGIPVPIELRRIRERIENLPPPPGDTANEPKCRLAHAANC